MSRLKELRCDGTTKKGKPCTHLIGMVNGSYEIKCPKCGKMHEHEAPLNKELSMYMQEFEQSQEREENFKATIRQLAYANQQLDAYNKQLLQENTVCDIIEVD